MSRRGSLVVRVFAGWTVFVWGVLVRNMLSDHTHSVGFRVVHIGLALVSITLAVATWLAVGRSRSARRASSRRGVGSAMETSR